MSAQPAADFADDEMPGAYGRPDMNVLGPIVAKVLKMPEFEELRDAEPRIEFLMRNEQKVRNGRMIAGTAYMPKVNGDLSSMFEWLLASFFGEFPDFLITLDAEYWADSDAMGREILVFHELSHCVHGKDALGSLRFDREGKPVFAILGHDIEEFNQVVRRYGAYGPQVTNFMDAVAAGESNHVKGRPLRGL